MFKFISNSSSFFRISSVAGECKKKLVTDYFSLPRASLFPCIDIELLDGLPRVLEKNKNTGIKVEMEEEEKPNEKLVD